MRVLLIEVGNSITIFPPIGLMHIASAIRDKHDVFIKDYSGKEINNERIKKDMLKINPDIIGVRVLTGPQIPRAIEVSRIAKKLEKKVVWGGPHPTILPYQTLENNYVDYVVIGEGEISFINLLKKLEGKKASWNGIGLKKNGKIIINPAPKEIVNIDKQPLPSWDLLEDIDRYFPEKKHNMLVVSTTRGCAFKCGFCHNSNENVKKYLGCYRIARPERAIEELKFVQSLTKKHIDRLNVGEDFHLISYDYAKRFCEAIKNSGLKIKWWTASRYSVLNKEIIDMIAETGCERMLLGVESGSRRIQEWSKKIVDLNHAISIAKYLKKKNIFLTNSYIFGHPTETPEELKETIKFIKKIPCHENLIQLYRPLPGTPYYEECIKSGKFKDLKKIEDWAHFGVLGNDVNVSKIPDGILFSSFYKINAIEQTKFVINEEGYYLKNKMYSKFFKGLIQNRFTYKLREIIQNKKESSK